MEMPAKVLLAWLALACAAAAQTTLNLSEDLVRLRIASTNMVPNQPSLDAGPLFFQAVSYARSRQISRVIADPGAYYFLSLQYPGAHVAWDSLSNLTIDLQGSDLYFSYPLASGMVISHSTNLVLENFTADYNPLPFTQVRVVSVDAAQRQIHFAVDGNWQNPSVLNAVFPVVPSVYGFGVEVHIFRNGRPIPGVTRMYATNPVGSSQFTATPDPGVNPGAMFAQIRPGDIAFLGMRAASGPFSVLYCTACTFRNIAVYSGTQWGFLAAHMQSSVFERIYSLPRPATDRLASNYVGVLLTDVGPNNQVRLNRTIRTMDDGLEYDASFLGTVKSQVDNRTFVLEGSITTKLSYGDSVPNGSPVAFQRLSDGTILTSAVVASQVAPPYTGQSPYQVTYTFDRDLPASVVGTLMFGTDLNQRGGNSVLERNALEEETDCCAGFLVAGLLNGIVRGNYIQRSGMTGLRTENSVQPGNFDLPPTANLNISNNVIDGSNWTRTGYPALQLGSIQIDSTNSPRIQTASPNQNISVTGNFIADSGSAAVWLGNTNGGSVTGNYFLNPNNNPAVESAVSFFGPSQPLVTQASQNITTSDNVLDQTSGRIWVTDQQYRELAAYAPGATIRLNAYGLGAFFPSPSLTLTDADGNTTPLAVQAATAHAIDAQIPLSAGLGGAYLTLTSGGAKYFGTLFLDAVDNIPALNGCIYEVSPSSTSIGASAGNLPILVVTQPGCSYQVLDNDSFVTPGAGGTGTGVVSVGFTANAGSDRATTIEVAGQQFSVTQTSQSNTLSSVKLLPQFAFGGGWYSALYFTMTGAGPVSFPVSFVGNDGNPLNVPALGGSSAIINLSSQGTAIIEAPNVGPLTQGYASVLLPPGVTGYAVFRQSVAGRPDQEAVVPLSSPSATATLIWDDTAFTTSVSVVGLSSAGSTATITARDLSGAVIGTGTIMVPPNGKQAIVLHDVPGLSALAGKRGSADFAVISGNIAVLGIRFGGSAFTDIPTASASGQPAVPTTMLLPQLAFGGGWYTALYFTMTGNGNALFPVNFIGNDGNPLNVPSVGGSSVNVNLAPRGTAIIEAPNTGSLTQGYVSAVLPPGVTGYAVFRQSVAGRPDQEAVVPLSGSSSTTSTLIWDDTAFTTAVAIVGLNATSTTVNITAWDQSGTLVGTSSVVIPPNGKIATVLHDLPGLSGMLGQRGSATFTAASGHVAVLGIRFGGSAFTDIPATDK